MSKVGKKRGFSRVIVPKYTNYRLQAEKGGFFKILQDMSVVVVVHSKFHLQHFFSAFTLTSHLYTRNQIIASLTWPDHYGQCL